MSKTNIKLSPRVLSAATSTSVMKDLGEIPMFDHTKTVDKMAKDSRDTFDGYEFHTDWNGSTNYMSCLLYTSPSPRDKRQSRMPSSA